jgi:hypothetical protein
MCQEGTLPTTQARHELLQVAMAISSALVCNGAPKHLHHSGTTQGVPLNRSGAAAGGHDNPIGTGVQWPPASLRHETMQATMRALSFRRAHNAHGKNTAFTYFIVGALGACL